MDINVVRMVHGKAGQMNAKDWVSPSPDGWRIVVPEPKAQMLFNILPGSACVAELKIGRDTAKALVYYEGDAYKRGMDWDEKLIHAYDRAHTSYPTIARMLSDTDDWIVVGYVTGWKYLPEKPRPPLSRGSRLDYTITNQAALDRWRGSDVG